MSFFRGPFVGMVMLGVAILSTGAHAEVSPTMTHQGRLLDAADQPVNGFFDITYRIFEVPSGGSPQWTEVHASVQVANGLFSALIGSTVPLSADVLGNGGGGGGGGALSVRYLEVSVGGATLSPRLALSSVPSAISSGHVSGDIETAPGLVVIGDTLTDNYATFGEKVNQGLHAAGGALASGKTRITNDCNGTSASQVIEKKGLNAVNVKLARTISSPPGGDVALDALDMDSDDDGVMDRSVSSSVDGLSAKHAINTKGTGATHNRVVSVSSSTTEDSAGSVCSMDLDGDGLADRSVSSSANAISARLKVTNIGSSGEDGVELLSLPASSSVAIKTKGTGASNARAVSISSGTADSTGIVACDVDDNGNGIPEYRAVLTVTDEDGDIGSDMRCVADTDDDGVPDNDASLHVTPTTSAVAIKTKGTGADRNRTASISSITGLSSASVACDIDDDGDGVPESEISQFLTPTTSSMAIKTKGTGAAHGRAITSTTDVEAASVFLAADLDGDGVSDNSVSQSSGDGGAQVTVAVDGSHRGHVTVLKGPVVMTDMDSDGNAYFASKVGIGINVPTHAVDVAGGAYCDGTNWVNASDRNSKENFTAVDGNELLNQIAQLSITRWNYKGNYQAEHIGPTAQDFKAAFGVGADDKSISTIDPSGIALAAIKALNNKMEELNAKTEEIAQLRAELDAIKAMLLKQASAKN